MNNEIKKSNPVNWSPDYKSHPIELHRSELHGLPCSTPLPHSERSNVYWAWREKLKIDPTCWEFSKREEAIAFAAFIEGWYKRTGEDPDSL